LVRGNRLLFFFFIFLISSSLLLSPILPFDAFYNKKGLIAPPAQIVNSGDQPSASSFSLPPNLAYAQSDNSQNQPSASFSLFPNVAFAQTPESGSQPSASFSLFPNVAFAQTPESGSQPSASFSITVSSDCLTGPSGTPSNGNDTLVGSNDPDDPDNISGGNGNDNIQGCAGDDILNGNAGDDVVDGGEGDDMVNGGSGADTLTGGPGADDFDCGSGTDTVTDYNPGEGDNLHQTNCENVTTVVSPPVITEPTDGDIITDCVNDFTVSGTSPAGTDSIILYKLDGTTYTELTTVTPAADGTWTTTLSPQDANLGVGTFTLVAQAQEGSTLSTDSNLVTITIVCPPTITAPEFVTDCDDFTVSGTTDPATTQINLYVDGNLLTSTTDITPGGEGEPATWQIILDPTIPELGNGDFTFTATAVIDENESSPSNEVVVNIDLDCPPVIVDPPDGTTVACEEPLTVSGTFDSSTFNSVEIFVDGNSAGFAELDGDTWTFTIPAEFLGEGTHTIVAEASTGGSEPFTSESTPITVTAECPPPPDGGGNGGGGNGGGGNGGGGNGGGGGAGGGAAGGAGGAGGGGGAAGSPVTNVQRTIFRVPYTDIACVQSVVELREDLIPTTDFPAVVEEVKSQFNLTVLNVWNVPDYKAMLLAEGDEEKLAEDARFLPAETTCGEIILEAILPANIHELADDVISQYHVKVVDIIDMPEYKAIVILAEPDNPITKDPRFVNYSEDYQLSENYTGSGELNLEYGHIAAPPTEIEEETIPDSIKRTFSAEELEEDSQTGDGEEAEVDVDIAILDTGIDLDHPDLNVYKDFSVIGINETGDDDQGHGTHVAGIAAAKNNGEGVIGGAPGARLWSVKVCDSEGQCKISDMIKGVQYVTEHADEIDVANISVETPLSPALNRAISAAIKAGVTFVVAAGNYGQDASLTSPASSPDVITVSAIADSDGKCGGVGPAPDLENSTDDTFAPFSNFGPSVSIAAPGVSVLSTYLNGEYAVDSGTSMAAPSVTAAAALIKANSTDFTPKQVKDTLLNSGSTPLTPCEGGPQGYFTGDPDQNKEPLLYRNLGEK
jgi:subtilisin family serine protease